MHGPSDPPPADASDASRSDGPAHYFSAEPTVASAPMSVTLQLPDLSLTLGTDRGVFSGRRVDAGTKLLLLDGPAPSPDARNLLDLGCGYGAIALTLARRAPAATVWAVDVNRRARELCAANAAANGITNVEVVDPHGFDDAVALDAIWSNPPIRIGKPAMHDLLLAWLRRLTPSGAAHLVVARDKGADSLQRWLADQGWPTVRRSTRAGYRLLDVSAAADAGAPSR